MNSESGFQFVGTKVGDEGYFTMRYVYLSDRNVSDNFWTIRGERMRVDSAKAARRRREVIVTKGKFKNRA